MKFNCDYFRNKREKRNERLRNWHKWFAWHPIRIAENDCRWLECVNRRAYCGTFPFSYYKYEIIETPTKINQETI